jgi:uncharacterized protein (DUF427 family)
MTDHRGGVRTEPSHKRVRIRFGGVQIVDTTDALYVWEGPWYPQYYVPLADVAAGVLVDPVDGERSPNRGRSTAYTVRAGHDQAVGAAWRYPESEIDVLRERVRFAWDAMDAWFEEDEEIFVHPRNPSTRVQILSSSRHVVVSIDGVVLADTHRPTFLYETNLPRRAYVDPADVRWDVLVPTATTSLCPYKGRATYWSAVSPQTTHTDVAWSYPDPVRESAAIAGLVAFYDERVDVAVDGIMQARPRTRFA